MKRMLKYKRNNIVLLLQNIIEKITKIQNNNIETGEKEKQKRNNTPFPKMSLKSLKRGMFWLIKI